MTQNTDDAEQTADAGLAEDAAAPAEDARFEDGVVPVRLLARDTDDLAVVSALLQDAALLLGDVAWLQNERRFVFVANRYRWEEPDAMERVRCGAHIEGVMAVRVRGVDPSSKKQPVALLSLTFEPSPTEGDPGGILRFTLSGGAEFEVQLEAIEAAMKDLTRPWKARSRPEHRDA